MPMRSSPWRATARRGPVRRWLDTAKNACPIRAPTTMTADGARTALRSASVAPNARCMSIARVHRWRWCRSECATRPVHAVRASHPRSGSASPPSRHRRSIRRTTAGPGNRIPHRGAVHPVPRAHGSGCGSRSCSCVAGQRRARCSALRTRSLRSLAAVRPNRLAQQVVRTVREPLRHMGGRQASFEPREVRRQRSTVWIGAIGPAFAGTAGGARPIGDSWSADLEGLR